MQIFVNNLGISLQLPELSAVIGFWDGLLQACFWAPNHAVLDKIDCLKMVFSPFSHFRHVLDCFRILFSLIFTYLCLYIFLFKLALIFVFVFVYLKVYSSHLNWEA
jgi:hypothetical protein